MTATVRGWVRQIDSGTFGVELDHEAIPRTYHTVTLSGHTVLHWTGSFRHWIDKAIDLTGDRNFDTIAVHHADKHEHDHGHGHQSGSHA